MAKIGIPTELLLAKLGDREALSDELWITSAQLGMLTAKSADQLQEDRKAGNPPPFKREGHPKYRLGSVRDHMFGLPEYNNTTQARMDAAKNAICGFASFHDWIDGARPGDEWPFLLPKKGPPIDFWKSLTMGSSLSEDDECGMLRLDDYLRIRREAAWGDEGQDCKETLDGATGQGSGKLEQVRV